MSRVISSPFSYEEAQRAHAEWGCNCGPAALAFALGLKLHLVRPLLPEFEARGYTNVTMMRDALRRDRIHVDEHRGALTVDHLFDIDGRVSLVRVQFQGPWAPDEHAKPARWAAHHTHWIATQRGHSSGRWIFDVNCGLITLPEWEAQIVPQLVAGHKRSSGGWHPTHIWRIGEATR